LLDQPDQELAHEINDTRSTISQRFTIYQSQFRATAEACRADNTTVPATMIQQHEHHNATISATKLALTEDTLAFAQRNLARWQLQLSQADLNGPGIARITPHIQTHLC
jgi:hypothetical protein